MDDVDRSSEFKSGILCIGISLVLTSGFPNSISMLIILKTGYFHLHIYIARKHDNDQKLTFLNKKNDHIFHMVNQRKFLG